MRVLFATAILCLFATSAHAQYGTSARDVVNTVRASWYDCAKPGQCSRSKRTASGEKFNPSAMTCAHKRLPFGTHLRVHYQGRSATCRINDRGPFVRGRELDMARAVAQTLGMVGVSVVKIEIVH